MSKLNLSNINLDTISVGITPLGALSGNDDNQRRPDPMEVLPAQAALMISAASTGYESPSAITVPSSAPYYVKALDSGRVWTNNGSGTVVTYTFWNSLPSAYSSSSTEARNFQPFTAAQKAAAINDLNMIASYANVTFVEVANSSNVDLGFANANLGSGAGAWAYYPGSGKGGDVWLNNYYSQTKTVTPGTYGGLLLAHEIGHAMGLKHSFESPYALSGVEDSSRWTVMSYNWPFYSESYMIYDIAALQAKYGTNMNHATGDDNYVLQLGHAYTIWDTGGIDTLDGSAISSAMTLHLNDGAMSSVGKSQNIGIAFNAVIENAKGGSGADIIYGNEANNHIWGNGGNDILHGSAGNDILDGGAGTDTVVYIYNISDFLINLVDSVTVTLTNALLGFDTLISIEKFTFGSLTYLFSDLQDYLSGGTGGGTGGGQNGITLTGSAAGETLTGGSGNDLLYGNGGYDRLYGGNGDDRIFGGSYIDKVYGDDGDDILYGYGSYDTLYGGNGNDTLYGGNEYDKLYGDAGNDKLYGEGGNDYLYGGSGDDVVSGGAGNDYLYGDGGNDLLIIGMGRDTAYGNNGSDIFAFDAVDSSSDYIRDFSLIGIDADKLNITDILTGFDANADIHNFVQLNVVSSSQMNLMVNQDGVGNDWVKAATVTGSGFFGVTVDDLIDNGQLIVSQSMS